MGSANDHGVFMLLQALPSATLIFFLLGFPLEMLLVLVLILPEKIRRSWPLIPYIPYLFFCDIPFPFFFGADRRDQPLYS
jgi:hypothetical protein